ncbi:MAG: ankyrin repeat domain-containing protein [Caldilineaceae bacterium]|nr:ankyrin repeat domain-containing protein [Caldilineaceae bacterium]
MSACLAFFEPALLFVCHATQIDSSTVLSASEVGDSRWIIDELAAKPGSCGELHEIHDTVRLGRADWVSCLAATDVELNACDDAYSTPLSIAAEKGSSELVQILVAAGADANVLDGFGESPLHIAQRNDDAEVVEVLVAAGAEGEGLPCLHAESVLEADEETEMLLGFLLMYVFLEESGELDAAITEMSQEVVSSLAEVFSEEGSDIETQALGDTSLDIVIEELVQIIVKNTLPVLTAEGVNTGIEDEVAEFLLTGMSEDADLEAGIAELQNIGFYDDKTADAITAFVHNFPAGLAKVLVAASAGAEVEEPITALSQSLVTDYAAILVAAGSDVDPAVLGQIPLQSAIAYIVSETLRVFLSEEIVQTLIAATGSEVDNSLLQVMGLALNEEPKEAFRIWGEFPLFDAIDHGDPEFVRLLVNTGADINATAGFGGNTALHEAVAQGSAEIVQVLVDAGADIEAAGFMGQTPLSLAAEEGATEIMKVLLGRAPDFATAASGDSKKAPSPSAIGGKALFTAIGSDNAVMVRLMVEAGADVNAAEGFGGNTPLHEAVENGNAEIVQILVDAGADIEAEGFMGRTPLGLAAEEGATEIMQILLGQGADNGTPEGEDKQSPAIGSEALFTAIKKGDVETVRLLVEAGADVNAAEGFGGNTPLHEAVEEGNAEIVQILVDAGADIEAEGFMGQTPLGLAAEEGASEIMQILLGQGADSGTPEGEDKQSPTIGSEALFTAIEKGDVETVRLLVEAGADVNAAEGFGGNTPLHEAVEEGNTEIVQILVDAGADIETEGFMGRTPLSLAAEEGATEIMRILLGLGESADTSGE